jgi:hypothetical protein
MDRVLVLGKSRYIFGFGLSDFGGLGLDFNRVDLDSEKKIGASRADTHLFATVHLPWNLHNVSLASVCGANARRAASK